MGQAMSSRQKFLRNHPYCCFCGGSELATTRDHIPSRACFNKRNWPEGFEFPACEPCNSKTRDDEQWVAVLSRMLPNATAPNIDSETEKYFLGLANNSPDILLGIKAVPFSDKSGAIFELPPQAKSATLKVFDRWARALHYRETHVIAKKDARIFSEFIPNTELTVPAEIAMGTEHILARNGINLTHQARYISYNESDDTSLGRYTWIFRNSFIAVMMVDIDGKCDWPDFNN